MLRMRKYAREVSREVHNEEVGCDSTQTTLSNSLLPRTVRARGLQKKIRSAIF